MDKLLLIEIHFRDCTSCRKALEIYNAYTVKNIFSSLLEDNSPRISFISICLTNINTGYLCSGSSFQGYLYNKWTWKTVFLSTARDKVVYRPD